MVKFLEYIVRVLIWGTVFELIASLTGLLMHLIFGIELPLLTIMFVLMIYNMIIIAIKSLMGDFNE